MRWLVSLILASCCAPSVLWTTRGASVAASAAAPAAPQFDAHLRRPVALATLGDRLFVANRRSGTVSVLDPAAAWVVGEVHVGARTLSDLAAHPADGRALYATDEAAGELLRLGYSAGELRVAGRLRVAAYPVSVRLAPDGSFATVASLWSPRLTIVDLPGDAGAPAEAGASSEAGAGGMRVRHIVNIPFAARQQWITPDGRHVVVADAFGGELAVVYTRTGSLLARRSIQAHNIRGMAAAPGGEDLLVAHQMLDGNTPTEASRVTWGQVVGNVLRAVPLGGLGMLPPDDRPAGNRPTANRPAGPPPAINRLGPAMELTRTRARARRTSRGASGYRLVPEPELVPVGHWSLYPLGANGAGAGDPGPVAVAPDGVTAIALSGVNQVALRAGPFDAFKRLPVGMRPAALAFSADARRLFVANTSDDSVSVVDVPNRAVLTTIPLGPQPALSETDRGEQLFHDARLALDGWYSCQSCHADGHTNSQLNDNLSDGSFGTPKRVLSLLGVETTQPWSWKGGRGNLEGQVQSSILTTMRGPHAGAAPENVNAIAAFIRTLPPPPGVDAARGTADPEAVARGRRVFQANRCGRCHGPPDYTSLDSFDVGLYDQGGQGHFNPPSLLGVSQRSRFLHDGRAESLRDVFATHRHPDGEPPAEEDLDDLAAYLRGL